MECPFCEEESAFPVVEEYEPGITATTFTCELCRANYLPSGEEAKLHSKLLVKRNKRIAELQRDNAVLVERLKQAECKHSIDVSGVCELCGYGMSDELKESLAKLKPHTETVK